MSIIRGIKGKFEAKTSVEGDSQCKSHNGFYQKTQSREYERESVCVSFEFCVNSSTVFNECYLVCEDTKSMKLAAFWNTCLLYIQNYKLLPISIWINLYSYVWFLSLKADISRWANFKSKPDVHAVLLVLFECANLLVKISFASVCPGSHGNEDLAQNRSSKYRFKEYVENILE